MANEVTSPVAMRLGLRRTRSPAGPSNGTLQSSTFSSVSLSALKTMRAPSVEEDMVLIAPPSTKLPASETAAASGPSKGTLQS